MESTTEQRASEQPVSNDAGCSIAQRSNFESAFDSHCCGCLRECACGQVFYDFFNSGYSWEEGELEALQSNPNAKGLEYGVGTIILDGSEYVMDCTCWHAKADRIIRWLTDNANEVAKFLNLEKQRKLRGASELISVD